MASLLPFGVGGYSLCQSVMGVCDLLLLLRLSQLRDGLNLRIDFGLLNDTDTVNHRNF